MLTILFVKEKQTDKNYYKGAGSDKLVVKVNFTSIIC